MATRSSQSRAQEIEDYLRAQEQVQAEQEYKKNRPWERGGNIMVGDMFGSLQDDPLLRAARERNYDQTQASAEYDARTAPGEYYERPDGMVVETSAPGLRAWETPQSVGRELFGGAAPAPAPLPELVKSGTTILARDPITGELVEKYKATAPLPKPIQLGNTLWNRDPMTGEMAMIASPPSRLDEQFDLVKLRSVESRRNKLAGMGAMDRLMLKPGEYEARLAALDDEENKILGKRPAAAASGSENLMRPQPFGFMDEPGAKNGFKSPFDIGVESVSGGASSDNAPTSRRPAATKAGLANQLAAEHPDWSREKIISEVNRSFR